MARNGKPKTQSDFGDTTKKTSTSGSFRRDIKWISPYVGEVDRNWLESNRDDMGQVILQFLSELPETYSFSSKFDNRTDRWLTTIICSDSNDPNDGLAITGRGSTRLNSAYTAAYFAMVKYEWRWMEDSDGVSSDFG